VGFERGLWWAMLALASPLPSMGAEAPAAAAQPCPPTEGAEPRRRSPRIPVLSYEPTPCDASRLPPSPLEQSGALQGLPDRWRLIESIGIPDNWIDPYHGNNPLKGDRPLFGEDWFLALIGVSDSVIEPRQFPLPVGGPVTERAGSLDTFGEGRQQVYAQTFALETVLYKGDTVFKPPDWEFRVTPVVNVNHVIVEERGVLKANVDARRTRTESAVGLQAAFVDKHLHNVSDRYDFDSLRVGVQPFTADFRGFLLNDSLFGVRLFGIRDDNRWQYNLAWFRRIDKDTNSGLNDLIERGAAALRDDDVFVVNAYYQDWPRLGFTVQGTVLHNRNREGGELTYDGNGIIQRPMSLGLERPREYDVTYVGASGDGHLAGINLSTSAYLALGEANRGVFVDRPERIRAGFFAAELSKDFSWVRNSLRPSKEFGQSNFVNPGLRLAGVGVDLDLTPTLRLSGNLNYLTFDDTAVLEVARAQAGIDREIGLDASLAVIWRPLAIQNVVARLSVASLVPGAGYRALYGDERAYSVLGNLVLTY